MIPKIIHQTWKTENIPKKWKPFVQKVRELNPDWEYRLWTDLKNEEFVRNEFPDLFPVYQGFNRGIMKADVIRYLIMYKIGGVYLDLDYEVLQAFHFGEEKVILPKNRSINSGDTMDELGNCIFASEPQHIFWKDVINDLIKNPPVTNNYLDVLDATGPGFLTRIYGEKLYTDIYTPERLVYHPPTPRNRRERKRLKNNGISLGIHHPWGSWKERASLTYLRKKIKMKLGMDS